MKKIILTIFILLIIMCNYGEKVRAIEATDIYIVYEKNSYNRGEIVNISIEIKAFANLFETILRYTYDNEVLEVIEQDGNYFYLNNHSIFSTFIVNKKFNQNVIYAEMLKDTLDEGFYSSYKNNLCKISFNAVSDISDITSCFENFQIYLFDNNHQIIAHNLKFQEKIKSKWQVNEIELEVGSALPDINELFSVINRNADEYLIFMEEELELTEVSEQVLQLGLYDLVTGYYQTYSKIVKVLDLTKPVISGNKEIIINDYELESYDFEMAVEVSDNYDPSPQIFVSYYDNETKITYSDAVKKIKQDQKLKVEYYAVDSSLNQSDCLFIEFKLKDTTSPKIIGNNTINIKDSELESFNLDECFQVIDNLDQNPQIVVTIYNYNGLVINTLEEGLKINQPCKVIVFGIDQAGNKSSELEVIVNLIDTTSPIIKGENVVKLNDKEVDDLDFTTLIEVSDCDPRPVLIVCKFNGDDNLSISEFKELIKTGEKGMIKYQVFDYSNNVSNFDLEIVVIDTTKPEIMVSIDNNGLYKELEEITWEVMDNFKHDVVVNVYIDNLPYDAELLTDGKHNLFIEAIDAAGNVSNLNYYFVISDASFIENLLYGNIKLKTSTYLIVIASLSALVVIIKILVMQFRKKKL